MSSNKERDAIFAQRAARAATDSNQPLKPFDRNALNAAGHRHESGRHTEVLRHANPGRTNHPKDK